MRSIRIALAAVVLGALCPASAPAVSPRSWVHDAADEFLLGHADGVSVLREGTLELAPEWKELAALDEPYVWDLAVDPKSGTIYVATGDDGWIYAIRPGKAAERFFQCASLEVLAVVCDEDGRLFAGVAPEGFIYSIDSAGNGSILHEAEESYVWDLALGPDGKLYAALGTTGAVRRIDRRTGRADTFFEIEDDHVVSLAFDAGGDLLLGTEGRGLVVRVDPKGNARVLHDSPEGEVSVVMGGDDGDVWAAASSAAPPRPSSNKGNGNGNGNGKDRRNGGKADRDERDDDDRDYQFDVILPPSGEGILYRIDTEGNVFRHWESGQGAIYDLARGRDGAVLAATGKDGGVFAVDARGRATLVTAADEEQVVALVPSPKGDGHFVATSNPSRVYRIEPGLRRRGSYRSEVLDAGRLARWGRVEWSGDGVSDVTVAVRTGNTREPDNTWSAWTDEMSAGRGDLSEAGRARYLQWRATLEGGGNKTPSVRRVRLSSIENNLPPLVQSVQVVPASNRFYDEIPEVRPRPLYQALPGGVRVQYSFDGGGRPEYPIEDRAAWTQGMRQIRWSAIDPNDDVLVFDLQFRREDETAWKTFAEDIEGELFAFNSRGVPDGEYLIRVIATDRRSNPNDERRTVADSESFVVDNTAPAFGDVESRREGGGLQIQGALTDELSDVIRVEYSVNGGDWLDAPPADGIFDSRSEGFEMTVELGEGDEHVVLMRGADLAGNLGATRVLLR